MPQLRRVIEERKLVLFIWPEGKKKNYEGKLARKVYVKMMMLKTCFAC